MVDKTSQKAGEAYAFFKCGASKQRIEKELPIIREMVGTSSKLELSLTEGMDQVVGDEKLMALAQEAKGSEINYLLKAVDPSKTNNQTAEELASVLNQAYQSPLYQANEPFRGQIAYQEKGNYIFRE